MSGTGGFQTQAYNQPVMAVAGDFASQNPYFSFDAGPGGLIAGTNGVTVGVFAWAAFPADSDGTPAIVYNNAHVGSPGPPSGFVHRAQQALITTFLADASMVIPGGFPVTLMTGGDFWVVNNGTTDAQMGQKVFASITNGQASMAASGGYASNVAGTSATVATTVFSQTGTITGNTLVVAGTTSVAIYPGAVLSGPGVGTVLSLVSGPAAGTSATFLLSVGEQSVTSTNIAGAYSILTSPGLSGTQTAAFTVGQIVYGGGLPVVPPVFIAYSISGSAGVTQTMVLSNPSVTVTATTVNGSNSVETRWWVQSAGLPGELVKITDHAPSV